MTLARELARLGPTAPAIQVFVCTDCREVEGRKVAAGRHLSTARPTGGLTHHSPGTSSGRAARGSAFPRKATCHSERYSLRSPTRANSQRQSLPSTPIEAVIVPTPEMGASALRCLPGLHVPRWRDVLQPDKREPLGPQMPTVRRSDRAGGRWSPLRPFSVKERAPRGRTP